jgi:hypothetical protein
MNEQLVKLNSLSEHQLAFTDISNTSSPVYVTGEVSEQQVVPAAVKQAAITHFLLVQRAEEAIAQTQREMLALMQWCRESHQSMKKKIVDIPHPLSLRDRGVTSMVTDKLLVLESTMLTLHQLFKEFLPLMEDTPTDLLDKYLCLAESSVTPTAALTFEQVEDILQNILAFEFVNGSDSEDDDDDDDLAS